LIALNKEPLVTVGTEGFDIVNGAFRFAGSFLAPSGPERLPGPQDRFGSGEILQELLVKSRFAG